jgi:hypothetical protein
MECDIFIVDNILKESNKGLTLIQNLRKINRLPFTSITVLSSYAPKELYLFKNIDIRPDIVMPMPFNMDSAKKYLQQAIEMLNDTFNIRSAYQDNDLNKIIKESSALSNSKFSYFGSELLAESVCKLGSFKTHESKLYGVLKSNMWPSYILAREYVREENFNKFKFLIEQARINHGDNIGLSYLYLQGNVMLQNAETNNIDNLITTRNNDYFNAPEYLYLISKYEYKREKFKSALSNQLAYVNDKAGTIMENAEDYKILEEYADSYLKSDEKKIESLVIDTIKCMKDAESRNFLSESLKVSALKFNIRLGMITKDYNSIIPSIIEIVENYTNIIDAHPIVLSDIIYTISNTPEMSEIKDKLCENTKIKKLIEINKVGISEKIESLLADAINKIKESEHSDAEIILSKILKNDPGNINASFMLADLKLYFASLTNNYTRDTFVNMSMQIIESSHCPKSEWQKEKRNEILEKAKELNNQ